MLGPLGGWFWEVLELLFKPLGPILGASWITLVPKMVPRWSQELSLRLPGVSRRGQLLFKMLHFCFIGSQGASGVSKFIKFDAKSVQIEAPNALKLSKT